MVTQLYVWVCSVRRNLLINPSHMPHLVPSLLSSDIFYGSHPLLQVLAKRDHPVRTQTHFLLMILSSLVGDMPLTSPLELRTPASLTQSITTCRLLPLLLQWCGGLESSCLPTKAGRSCKSVHWLCPFCRPRIHDVDFVVYSLGHCNP